MITAISLPISAVYDDTMPDVDDDSPTEVWQRRMFFDIELPPLRAELPVCIQRASSNCSSADPTVRARRIR